VSWSRTSQADRDGAAIKLMTDAGYGPKKPLNIRLAYPTSENRKRLAVATAAMWKKLGVNVELVQTELKVLTANLRQGDFEIGTFAWGAEYNDAREFLYFSQTSAQQNWPRFSNPDYDRLMDEAAVTSGQAKRAQLLEQGEQILLRELPFLPLFFNVSKNLAVPAQLVSALLVTGAELLGEKDARRGKPAVGQFRHPIPREAVLLAAPPKRSTPEVGHVMPEWRLATALLTGRLAGR
jgi:ABC-type oligopeptide transport system substrate-binding subunit